MSTHLNKHNRNAFYFFTITCFGWIPLFEITGLYDNIYNWFDILKKNRILMNAYVIMPNHLHAIIYANDIESIINNVIGTGKRFMAYEIVDRLKRQSNLTMLQKLAASLSEREKEKGSQHNVFEPSMDIKEIESEKFMIQKINYIHQNPVRGKWRLAEDYRTYRHSSAGFYEPADSSVYSGYPVAHYANLDAVYLPIHK